MRPQRTGNAAATRRQPAGKDNFAPAEDLHNKNPSLVALGKNIIIIMAKSTGLVRFGPKINQNQHLGLGSGSHGLQELKKRVPGPKTDQNGPKNPKIGLGG